MDHRDHQAPPAEVNETRRRLTQGGLATPLVLATLASRNALAGGSSSTPYKCTISGKLSGNTSQPGTTKSCNQLGGSCSYWNGTNSWGSFKQGSCAQYGSTTWKNDRRNYPTCLTKLNNASYTRGTKLSECQGSVYKISKRSLCKKVTNSNQHYYVNSYGNCRSYDGYHRSYYCGGCGDQASGNQWSVCSPDTTDNDDICEMTMQEILCLDDTSPGATSNNYRYHQEACVAILNAHNCSGYPLSVDECIAMYNATCNGGQYKVTTDVYWTQQQVCDYWACLHT